MLPVILLVFSFVLFVIAAVWVSLEPHRPRLVAAGLAFWVLADIVSHWPLLSR